MVRFKPHECPHARTTIYYQDEDTKVEECKQCDTIVRTFDVSETYECGHPIGGGGECSRKVDKPNDFCWQHIDS